MPICSTEIFTGVKAGTPLQENYSKGKGCLRLNIEERHVSASLMASFAFGSFFITGFDTGKLYAGSTGRVVMGP